MNDFSIIIILIIIMFMETWYSAYDLSSKRFHFYFQTHRVTYWKHLLNGVEAGDMEILNDMDSSSQELTLLRNQDIPTSRVIIDRESVCFNVINCEVGQKTIQ